jgi:hypothetical protein
MADKADLDRRFHGMKDELITRLQNACAQRDEARAQVKLNEGHGSLIIMAICQHKELRITLGDDKHIYAMHAVQTLQGVNVTCSGSLFKVGPSQSSDTKHATLFLLLCCAVLCCASR